ncbi:Heat shock protein 70 family [Trypanosoma melophagium]|uniref:Heat shock protein 70 family n=1 Tax=Trypanosoma melophagium TaxID=715481 RepID=UPI00351A0EE1|nr:Heat shock protein 70 family [Trypanosoma melophagium]
MRLGPAFKMAQDAPITNSIIVKISLYTFLLPLILLLAVIPSYGEARHLLAVDIGVDWVKAATFGTNGGRGFPLRANVVLNDQANRKSPQCVAFRFMSYGGNDDDTMRGVERVFAEQAYALEPRFPEEVFCGMSLLMGRSVQLNKSLSNTHKNNDSAIMEESDELTAEDVSTMSFSVVPRPPHDTATIRIVNNKKSGEANMLEFTAEEIVGMYLGYMKRMAERGLDGEPVRHLTVTVPILASLAHRQAIVDAAAIAGLRTVRVVHGTTAAAAQLSYLNMGQLLAGAGNTRKTSGGTLSSSESNAKYVMIYDMGSRRTEVAVYRITSSKTHLGTITRVAAVVNSSLGGRTFDRCLARYAEEKLFPKISPKPIEPVLNRHTSTPAVRRAAVSLMRGVNNVRERLSVNQEAPLVVQGIADGGTIDFTTTISRATFELECNHLFDEAVRMRDRAMAQVNETLASLQDLTRFEVIGGATRMPKLLQRLSDGYGKMVDRTLNADEASVVGALYIGAAKANIAFRGFHVIEKLTNDVYFSVTPPLNAADEVDKERPTERYLLFAKGSVTVPAVRSLQFKDRTSDFTFTLEDSKRNFVRAVTVFDVKDTVELAQQVPKDMHLLSKHRNTTNTMISVDHMAVVVEVTLSDSGIPFVSNVFLQATYIQEGKGENDTANENETEKKFSTTNATDTEERESTEPETTQSNGEDRTQDESVRQQQEKEEEGEGEEEEEKEQVENKEDKVNPIKKYMNEKNDNITAAGSSSSSSSSEEKRITRHFERFFPLAFKAALVSTGVNMNKSEAVVARDRLRAFQHIDDERLRRSALRNDIEGLILHYKSLDAWDKTTQVGDGVTQWKDVVTDVSRWLDDASDDVEVSALQSQYERLKKLQVS